MVQKSSPLLQTLDGLIRAGPDGNVHVEDPSRLRAEGIDRLVRAATFGPEPERPLARHLIWGAAHDVGILSSSIQGLYEARGQKKVKGFTVPAINLRGPTYDMGRAALRAARSLEVGALIFELAKSEMQYTHQPPVEYATSILAAAIKEGWSGPLFIQGDHFQFNAKKYAADPAKETDGIRALIREAIAAGFHNIDIDASTLVDLGKPTVAAQQAVNSQITTEMTALVRSLEPSGVTISVGGEIGEVGKKNSTEEELRSYLDQFLAGLKAKRHGAKGVSKVSIQTGTHHGGLVDAGGKVIKVQVDFDAIKRLSAVAVEEYGLAGCVQHGASTLPDNLFHKFPEAEAAEIHLATGFQNAFFDHPAFPADLKQQIYAHLEKAHADERKPGETLEQFHYKTRKKSFGPFKRELWELPAPTKASILKTLEERFAFLYRELRVPETRAAVGKHVRPVAVAHAPPAALA